MVPPELATVEEVIVRDWTPEHDLDDFKAAVRKAPRLLMKLTNGARHPMIGDLSGVPEAPGIYLLSLGDP